MSSFISVKCDTCGKITSKSEAAQWFSLDLRLESPENYRLRHVNNGDYCCGACVRDALETMLGDAEREGF